MATERTLEERFRHNPPPNNTVIQVHQTIRFVTLEAAEELERLLPYSRERNVAITKLEEARMWANACAALYPEQVTNINGPEDGEER